MKRCLVDVNVWLALVVVHHEHHAVARTWFDKLAAGEAGLCRIVQLAIVRLLGNASIMGQGAIPPSSGWSLVQELLEDERVDFVSEPPGLDTVMPSLLTQSVPAAKLITDAYLSAFAIAASRRLVTLDRAFRQFRGLDVEVIGPREML